ncbi:MAG: tetratricopeptide repeat protein [Myxococcales bacterium]|nr:tetratricopeptide repeat protein [Myxococcales bacterium]
MSIALAAARIAQDQAERLGNIVRALELVSAAWTSADPESHFYLTRVGLYVINRLEARHDPVTVSARVTLPAPLAEALEKRVRELDNRPTFEVSTNIEGRSVYALLVDSEASHEAFVAELTLRDAIDGRNARPEGTGAAFNAALERAESAVLRLLASRHQLVPARVRALAMSLDAAGKAVVADGASIAVPAALLYYAAYSGAPLPPDVLSSGDIDERGRLRPVSAVAAKTRAARRERPLATRLVLAADDAREAGASASSANVLELVGDLFSNDDAESDELRIVGAKDIAELIGTVFGEGALRAGDPSSVEIEASVERGVALFEKHGDSVGARVMLEAALGAIFMQRGRRNDPALWRREELLCRWRIGAALVHAGRVTDAAETLRLARALSEDLWVEGAIDPKTYLGLRGNLAVLWRDSYRYDEARALLEETLELQRSLKQSKREQAKTLGNLGELCSIMGDFTAARRCLERSLRYLRETYPEEVPRARCYLGNLALREGELDEAHRCFEKGLEENVMVQSGARANAAFLRYGLARAYAARGQHGRAADLCDVALDDLPEYEPYPRQLILKVRGLSALAQGEREDGEGDLLAASDTRYVIGAFLRYGVMTASGELALALLDADDAETRWREIEQRALALADAMAKVPGLVGDATPDEIRELLEPGYHTDRAALATALRHAIDRFPY